MSRTSSQPTVESGLPALVPHGRFKGKPAMPLGRPVTTIGARSRSHIHLLSSSVSKSHAMVVNNGAGFYIRDLASRTHVLINGQKVREADLVDGDIVAVGPFTFRFTDPGRKSRRGSAGVRPPAGVLRVARQPLPLSLESRVTVIGRRPNCDIVFDEMDVSTTHAVVFEMGGKRYVRDLGSRTGTFVNGTPVHQQAIEFGDTIKIGSAEMSYVAAADIATGADLHDELEDLAGTAQLIESEEPLDLGFGDEPDASAAPIPEAEVVQPTAKAPAPTARDAREPAPIPLDDEFDLDLSLEPSVVADATPAVPLIPAPTPIPRPVPHTDTPTPDAIAVPSPADLTSMALEPEPTTALPDDVATIETAEPGTESAFGIELLPHDEPTLDAAAAAGSVAATDEPAGLSGLDLTNEPVATATPADTDEADLGLDFADDLAPVAAVPPVKADAPEISEVLEPAPLDDVRIEIVGAEAPVATPDEVSAQLARDLAPADLSDVEVIGKTEPTPESAFDVAVSEPAASAGVDTWQPETSEVPDSMTDSVFGREVAEFEGRGLGPLVEAPKPVEPKKPEPTPVSELDQELEDAFAGGAESDASDTSDIDALIFDEVPAPAAPVAAGKPAAGETSTVAEEPSPVVEESAEVEAPPAVVQETPIVAEEQAPEAAAAEAAESEQVGEDVTPKRRGGRKAAAAKAPRKPATPKRKPPGKKQKDLDVAATAVPTELPVDDLKEIPSVEVANVPAVPPTDDLQAIPPAEADVTFEPLAEIPAQPDPIEATIVSEATAEEAAPEEAPVEQIGHAPIAGDVSSVASVDEPAEETSAVVASDEPLAEMEALPPLSEVRSDDSEKAIAEPAPIELDVLDVEAPADDVNVSPAPVDVLSAEPEAVEVPPSIEHADSAIDSDVRGEPAVETDAAELSSIDLEIEADAGDEKPAAEVVEADIFEPDDALVFDEAAASEQAAVGSAEDISEPAVTIDLSPASPARPAAPADEVPKPLDEAAPAKPVDLFYGLERDTASFLGGMPLQLPPLPTPAAPARVDFTPAPARPEPDVHSYDAESDIPEADEPELLPELSGDYGDNESLVAEAPVDDAPAASPAPVAETPKPKHPVPPPPARMGPRVRQGPPDRAVANPFGSALEGGPGGQIEIPPFAGPGPATRGQVTTAFDGLAMPPVREADVFSQKPFGDTAIPPFGGVAGQTTKIPASAADDDFDDLDNEEPLDLTSVDDDGVNVDAGEADAPGEKTPANEGPAIAPTAAPEGRKLRPAVGGQRRPPSYPAEPVGGRPVPKKKRFRIGKWGLFVLMLACMGAASGGIWFAWPKLFPNTAQITAWLRFEKLDTLPEAQRQDVLIDQRNKLEKLEVRASAREILEKKYGGIAPGFLTEKGTPDEVKAATVAYSKLTDGLRLVEKKPAIQLDHRALDGDADRKRVQALLDALYAENKPLKDAAGQAKRDFDAKTQQLALQTELRQKYVLPAVEKARQEVGGQNAVEEKRAVVEALQKKERELSAAWDGASKRVKALTADLQAAEAQVPFNPDADPAVAPPIDAADDSQVAELTARVEKLNADLAARKEKHTAQADAARKALAASLKQFEDDIASARGSMTPDSELGTYLDAAAQMQSQLKVASAQLAQQQRSDMERLTMLKRKLADKNEARIRQAFASDADLQRLQDNLALKERHYNTAVGSGLRDDARALEKEVQAYKLEIEARQDLLTTADGIAPDMKDLEDFITDMLARMEQDRARNDRQMADILKKLASQAPAAGSLPAEQKAFAEKLEKRQAELNKAREQYTAAANAAATEADAEMKNLESELAAATAKADERKKQLAASVRKSLSEEQQKVRAAMTASRQRDLDKAMANDEAAAAAFFANRQALNTATAEFDRTAKRTEGFDAESRKAVELSQNIQTLSAEVEKLRQQVEGAVVPVEPLPDDIAVMLDTADNRGTYILATNLVLGVMFFGLVLIAPAHPERIDDEYEAFADDSDVPFAAPAADPDDRSIDAATVMEEATARAQKREEESVIAV